MTAMFLTVVGQFLVMLTNPSHPNRTISHGPTVRYVRIADGVYQEVPVR